MHVVFSLQQVAPVTGFSPSAGKPLQVVEQWRRLDPEMRVHPPVPVSRAQLHRAHDEAFVDGVLDGQRSNGFGNRHPDIAASLPFTSGALLTAARIALREKVNVAAPVSGFHHEGWDYAAGYCTFNGLVVTALDLLADGEAKRVGILDYDYHHGDGTEQILDHLGVSKVVHYTAGAEFFAESQASAFMLAIESHLELMQGCDVVLYQAGADPHIDDPLGGFLTTAQLVERDRQVFQGLKRRGIPCAWVLAGGYQEPLQRVLDIHNHTYRAFMSAG